MQGAVRLSVPLNNSGALNVVKFVKPRINFKAYRKPAYMLAVHKVFGPDVMVYAVRYRRGPCPLCCPVKYNARCFSWSFEKCAFYCHSCKAKGDALELVRLLMKCSVVDAAKWLEERGGPSGSGIVLAGDARYAATRDSTQ